MATGLTTTDKAKRARELTTKMQDATATPQARLHACHGLIDLYTPELTRSLPAGVNGSRLVDVARQHLREKPELLECTPDSLMSALSRAMLGGMELGGPRPEAYVVPFNTKCKLPGGKEVWRKIATCIESWRGLVKLIANTGRMTRQPLLMAVYHGEDFRVEMEDYQTRVRHSPDAQNKSRLTDDDGAIEYVYAVVWIDGQTVQHWMPRAEIEAVRIKHSKSQSTWETHWREMAYKTVIRQMIARGMVPISHDLVEAMRRAQASEAIERAAAEDRTIDAATWTVLGDDAPAEVAEEKPQQAQATSQDSDGQMGDRP